MERANLWLNSNYVRSAVLGALNHPNGWIEFRGQVGRVAYISGKLSFEASRSRVETRNIEDLLEKLIIDDHEKTLLIR